MTQQPRPIPLRPDYAAVRRDPNFVVRAAFISAKAKASGADIDELSSRLFPNDHCSRALLGLTRATAPIGSSSTPTFASELAVEALGAFLESLQPASAAAALMGLGVRFTLDEGVASVNFPACTTPVAPQWVAEGNPIPVSSAVLATVPLGPSRKLGVIVVGSHELFKRAGAATVFSLLLREAAATSLDGAYFSSADGSGSAPAGLLYGAPTAIGTAGADDVALKADLRFLIDSVSAAGSSELVLVTSNARAIRMSMRVDIKANWLASPAVAADTVIAVDPQSIIHGVGSDPDIVSSTEAVLHMSDAPLPLHAGVVQADPQRSLYQTASVATRMVLPIAFAKRRSAAAAYITSATW